MTILISQIIPIICKLYDVMSWYPAVLARIKNFPFPWKFDKQKPLQEYLKKLTNIKFSDLSYDRTSIEIFGFPL